MNIIAFDCGVTTGYAALNDDRIVSGTQKFELKRGESPGIRFLRFNAWLKEICELTGPTVLVYEQAHHRGGHATQLLVGMTTRIEEMAVSMGIEYSSCHTATLKKWATGSGRANKDDMVARACALAETEITDDNEADAYLLLRWAMEEFAA